MKTPRSVLFNRAVLYSGIALVFVFGFGYAIVALLKYKEDTLQFSLTAFAMLLATASALFGYARAIEDGQSTRDEILFSAERFLHAALCMFVATILKWGLFQYDTFLGTAGKRNSIYPLQLLFCSLCIGLFFSRSIVEACRALFHISSILEIRRRRKILATRKTPNKAPN